ncbi:MAG: enoyl-CoA hydratase-related protein [Planctomycetota bacterium]
MKYEDILFRTGDGVAHITINRPRKYNAFRGSTLREMIHAFRSAADDREVGVIVLTGAGEKAFCAGGDVQWEAEGSLETESDDAMKSEAGELVDELYEVMRTCYKPTIARVNGYAIGGGNHLAYFCDFTIASENAIFGQNGARVGSPAGGYIVNYLVRVLGQKRAREMWMLCRRYTAKQALDWGLANAVVPMEQLDDEVRRWCDELLALSPTCLKIFKATFDDEAVRLREHQRNYVGELNPGFFESGEQQEGAAAFQEKRAPDFSRFR